VQVDFLGTRGSLAAPGADTARYGGNTSCVEITGEGGHRLLLDAGTGLRLAGHRAFADTRRIDLLLTHLHMDHLQGLGFFGPLYQSGREIHIWGPPSTTSSLRRRLGRYLSPPLFPVRLRDLESRVICHDVVNDTWDIGPFRVTASLVCHPDPTLGFRIESQGRSVCYLPDHEPQLGVVGRLPKNEWLSGFRLSEGSDLLIHDAQYTSEEYKTRVGWGHATVDVAVDFARQVGAEKLALFHHDPDHTDAFMDQVVASAKERGGSGIEIVGAMETAPLKVL